MVVFISFEYFLKQVQCFFCFSCFVIQYSQPLKGAGKSRVHIKRPLEVGADRIARTAHSALGLLSKIGEIKGYQIPLVWKHNQLPPLSAIEVYPSATLRARSVKSEGYKGKDRGNVRSSILQQIQNELDITIDNSIIVNDDNMFDAVICALAAFDFLNGECVIPVDLKLARKEGWIWFRRPNE